MALYFSAQAQFVIYFSNIGWKSYSLETEGGHTYKFGFDDRLYIVVDTTKFYLETQTN